MSLSILGMSIFLILAILVGCSGVLLCVCVCMRAHTYMYVCVLISFIKIHTVKFTLFIEQSLNFDSVYSQPTAIIKI